MFCSTHGLRRSRTVSDGPGVSGRTISTTRSASCCSTSHLIKSQAPEHRSGQDQNAVLIRSSLTWKMYVQQYCDCYVDRSGLADICRQGGRQLPCLPCVVLYRNFFPFKIPGQIIPQQKKKICSKLLTIDDIFARYLTIYFWQLLGYNLMTYVTISVIFLFSILPVVVNKYWYICISHHIKIRYWYTFDDILQMSMLPIILYCIHELSCYITVLSALTDTLICCIHC